MHDLKEAVIAMAATRIFWEKQQKGGSIEKYLIADRKAKTIV